MNRIKKAIKSITEEQVRMWFLYFVAMGLILTIIILILGFFHGEPPLYIHGIAALEAGVFAILSTLVKQGKLFKKKRSLGEKQR